jgi:iron-sulfur cluster repair protein YtfE (RIC family)
MDPASIERQAATGSVGAMKRSKALRALSHQHHQGLFAALQLKRAGPKTAVEARQVFLEFYEREGSRHFRVEEELLLPAFARHVGVDDAAIVRVLTEHVDLRGRGQDLERSADPDPATLRELGERLASHIRFEERVLFPMIEEALPVDELERLGAAFARAEADGE